MGSDSVWQGSLHHIKLFWERGVVSVFFILIDVWLLKQSLDGT